MDISDYFEHSAYGKVTILYVMFHAPVTYRKHTVCMAFYGGRVVTNEQKAF